MSLLRQSALAAISGILLTGSRFAFTAILARRLSVDDFGRFAYALWLVDIAFLVCALGATGAVSRYAAEFRNDKETLNSFLKLWRRWAIGLPPIAGFAVLLGGWLSNYQIDTGAKLMLSLWTISSGLMAMQLAALNGFQRFELVFRSNVIFAVVILTGALLLPINDIGVAGLFSLMAGASISAALPGLLITMKSNGNTSKTLDASKTKKIRNYALNMWLVALLWSLVWSRGEMPVVRHYLGNAGVAQYAAVLAIFGGAIQGVMLGISAVSPQLTRLWGEGKHDSALQTARNVMDYQLMICGLSSLLLICFGPELLHLVFGEMYKDQSLTLAILSFGLISMALANQNHLLQIETNGKFSRNSSAFGLCALAILSYTLIPKLGVTGAAASRVGAMLILAVLSMITFIQLWGSQSLALWNIGAVTVLILCSLVLATNSSLSDFVSRLYIFLVSSSMLLLAVRNTQGQPKVIEVARAIKCRAYNTFRKQP